MFCVLLHIYYPDSWASVITQQLSPLKKYNPLLLVNICNINQNLGEMVSVIRSDFPGAIIISTPNKGKDIGGKLALIELFLTLKLNAEYLVLLHDKRSPHAVKGEDWRNSLFSIIKPGQVETALSMFTADEHCGAIGSSAFLMNEYDRRTGKFDTNNDSKIHELLIRYQLQPKNYSFIGGSMFWTRSVIVQRFFSKFPALDCREQLEDGNVMDDAGGTYTHTWERLLCWLAADQQYTVKGI